MVEANPGTTWHISTKESISIRNLIEKICDLCDVQFNSIVKVTEERLGKDQNYLLDSSLIRENFGWRDNIDLITGIKETIRWVDENYDLLYKLPWNYLHKS